MYAAAVRSQSLWAAASGSMDDAADEVISRVSVLAGKGCPSSDEISACAAQCSAALKPVGAQVSLAGIVYDGNALNMFNIGNARTLLFSRGYALLHSDDHTHIGSSFSPFYILVLHHIQLKHKIYPKLHISFLLFF